ncbi:TetR/AcrR family transcriptional regulator [Rhodococcus sp. D2-41]|uniref:WHG domain-containing protein n=1 Tax=Speluncibacter jeojiensis TaxID=2710754 RepID=A0A9X4RCV9_9ACTN|nr:TetR-like C-terminal domain-containing protein [Rhodococcus sp. D2-41]MDG3012007.1 TetR/AcrR family transcriptional regulator [Rhodococcus sp. D2-41]MDG3013462.1 WHG domain-containing protein [Corynebacteriales bacterium D3-21]
MTGTPRARARVQTMSDILRIGRTHLSRHGAAALSLRAVARDLGVVSSAVYRYVPSRDALLTMLIEDAYTDLGAATTTAERAVPRDRYRDRFLAVADAVRGWALAEPARYGLLFGSPVPGYVAPAERTTEPGTVVVRLLVGVLRDAHAHGALHTVEAAVPAALGADLRPVLAEYAPDLPEDALARGVLCWAALFGAVSFEVFGQYGANTFAHPELLFAHQMRALADTVGLRPST